MLSFSKKYNLHDMVSMLNESYSSGGEQGLAHAVEVEAQKCDKSRRNHRQILMASTILMCTILALIIVVIASRAGLISAIESEKFGMGAFSAESFQSAIETLLYILSLGVCLVIFIGCKVSWLEPLNLRNSWLVPLHQTQVGDHLLAMVRTYASQGLLPPQPRTLYYVDYLRAQAIVQAQVEKEGIPCLQSDASKSEQSLTEIKRIMQSTNTA